MSRRLVLTTFFLAVLIGTLGLSFEAQMVEASGTIYIRADGSIDPPTAPISSVDNVTYVLTGNITSDAYGIVVLRSNVTIKNAKIKDFDSGISFFGNTPALKFNRVLGNDIVNNTRGITGGGFSYNISGNNIINNTWGVELFASSNNTIAGNNIIANAHGITLWGESSNNSIFGNSIDSNIYGISLVYGSLDNQIFHNNFVNNAMQADSWGYNNTWDDGYPSGGNYWSDYNGYDSDHDGIGDTPYFIDENNTDHYPLMVQYVIPEFPSFLILPLFFIAALLAVAVYRGKHFYSTGR